MLKTNTKLMKSWSFLQSLHFLHVFVAKACFHAYNISIVNTFHHYTIAVHINQWFRQVLVVKLSQVAFSVAFFWAYMTVSGGL